MSSFVLLVKFFCYLIHESSVNYHRVSSDSDRIEYETNDSTLLFSMLKAVATEELDKINSDDEVESCDEDYEEEDEDLPPFF